MSKLAINGGTPVFAANPAAPWPEFDERERDGLLRVLESRKWGGYPEPSPEAGKFAHDFATAHGAKFGVCVTNGSVTLEVALTALGIEAGDEVITTAYTWIASAVCAIHVNAVPVLVDIDPDTYTLDPDAVEAAITPRTRAIVVVHLGANIADMDRLREIAAKHDLWLIEDCAHAHGGAWRGEGVGSMGIIGSFSFQVSKLMTAGEGGGLISSDDDLMQRCHSVVNCGRKEPGYDRYEGTVLGVNARMTDFQAVILRAQLARLEQNTTTREGAMRTLTAHLADVGGLTPLHWDERMTRRPGYQFIMKYDAAAFGGVHRDVFLRALAAEGVGADGDFYVPLPDHELYVAETRHWPQLRGRYGDGVQSEVPRVRELYPTASRAAYDEAVWLHYPYLMSGDATLEGIAAAVAKIRDNVDELRAL